MWSLYNKFSDKGVLIISREDFKSEVERILKKSSNNCGDDDDAGGWEHLDNEGNWLPLLPSIEELDRIELIENGSGDADENYDYYTEKDDDRVWIWRKKK